MASPVNQHCASCIGTLSFPIPAGFYRHLLSKTRRNIRYCDIVSLASW